MAREGGREEGERRGKVGIGEGRWKERRKGRGRRGKERKGEKRKGSKLGTNHWILGR